MQQQRAPLYARIVPFIGIGIALVVMFFALIIGIYLLVFGSLVGVVLFVIVYLKRKFFTSKTHYPTKRQGKIYDHRDSE